MEIVAQCQAGLHSAAPDHQEQAMAILLHTGIKDPACNEQVINLLQISDNVRVRRGALHLVATFRKTERVRTILKQALRDDDWQVKGNAFLAIKKYCKDYKKWPEVRRFIESETHPFCLWCIREA